jgi:hypothetical protein
MRVCGCGTGDGEGSEWPTEPAILTWPPSRLLQAPLQAAPVVVLAVVSAVDHAVVVQRNECKNYFLCERRMLVALGYGNAAHFIL